MLSPPGCGLVAAAVVMIHVAAPEVREFALDSANGLVLRTMSR